MQGDQKDAERAGGAAMGEFLQSIGKDQGFYNLEPEEWERACSAFIEGYSDKLKELSEKLPFAD